MISRLVTLLVISLVFALHPTQAHAEDNFSFRADSMTGSMTKGREEAILTGNATVISDSLNIKADKIKLYGEDFRFIECYGNVSVVDKEKGFSLFTQKLSYDRKNKIAKMTGPSIMEDKKNKVVIKGDYIENDDERKIAIIQINVRILKEKLSCRAEFARYDRDAKTLELSGSPYVTKDSDTYQASTIFVNIDTEDIKLTGTVSGVVASQKKDKASTTEDKASSTEQESSADSTKPSVESTIPLSEQTKKIE